MRTGVIGRRPLGTVAGWTRTQAAPATANVMNTATAKTTAIVTPGPRPVRAARRPPGAVRVVLLAVVAVIAAVLAVTEDDGVPVYLGIGLLAAVLAVARARRRP